MKKTKPPAPELKSAAMHMMIKPSVKALAISMAAADDRSLAHWLEIAIKAEHARRTERSAANPRPV